MMKIKIIFSLQNTQKQKFLVPRKSEDFLGFGGISA